MAAEHGVVPGLVAGAVVMEQEHVVVELVHHIAVQGAGRAMTAESELIQALTSEHETNQPRGGP